MLTKLCQGRNGRLLEIVEVHYDWYTVCRWLCTRVDVVLNVTSTLRNMAAVVGSAGVANGGRQSVCDVCELWLTLSLHVVITFLSCWPSLYRLGIADVSATLAHPVAGPPLLNGRCTSLLRAPVSEMTYTVSSGMLNSTIPSHTALYLYVSLPFCIVLFVCSVSWLFLLGCQYQCKWLTGKTRLRNDLWCVDGDVKPYSLTHSLPAYLSVCMALTSRLLLSVHILIHRCLPQCDAVRCHPLFGCLGKEFCSPAGSLGLCKLFSDFQSQDRCTSVSNQ